MNTSLFTPELLKIRIHHIGGIGGYGPTSVLKKIEDTQWVVYDADTESLESADDLMKKDFLTINYCIGKTNGRVDFNVMRARSSSSMLSSSPEAAAYTVLNPDGKTAQIWGEHTKVEKTFPIDIHTIDWLVEQKKIPPVDFISIDAQGAERDIFQGAARTLSSSVIGVECETDFSELYEKQGLFGDVHQELLKNDFRLCQIYNHQYFNTTPLPKDLQGKGFLTVGETLFLKNLNNLEENMPADAVAKRVAQFLKLAAVSVMFDQLDFAITVLDKIERKKKGLLKEIAAKSGVKYAAFLSDLYDASRNVLKMTGVPVYGSTNKYDRKREMKNPAMRIMRRLTPRVAVADPNWLAFIFRRYRRKFLLKWFNKRYQNYNSEISKVYAAYSFYDLAEMHEKRLAEFVSNIIPRYRSYQRNKFKGTHAA